MAVALAALDATVEVLGAHGERTIPMPGLHRLPGDSRSTTRCSNPGDLITRGRARRDAARRRSVYRKVRDRASFAFAVLSVAAVVGGARTARSTEAPDRAGRRRPRAVAGARRPKRCCGARGERERSQRRPKRSSRRREPLRDNAFKVPLARNVLVRTLAELTA